MFVYRFSRLIKSTWPAYFISFFCQASPLPAAGNFAPPVVADAFLFPMPVYLIHPKHIILHF